VPAGTVCDETVSIVDTLATLAAITGHALPEPAVAAEDSFDVSKAWLGEDFEGTLRPDLIVHSADGNFAIRRGRHKWIEGVPADDVKPASKKARAIQFRRQLYDLGSDVAESQDLSAEQPTVVAELESLLNRYRDGGYSRELPPAGVKPKAAIPPLPPLTNAEPVDLARFRGAGWTQREGVWAGAADAKGAPLGGPLALADGVFEFQIRLGEADRHSLRIHTAGNTHSFRIVLSRAFLEIAKNPSKGEAADQVLPLGKTRVKFKADDWLEMRLTFRGDELTVECAGTTTKAEHAVFSGMKEQANFIAFDGEVQLKNVAVSRG
jgi:hypothetical protein